ncbi:Hypothetical predicted protein [Marmota monax]|uniref:Uncharacterized protein n=1 Tax=Marmota monax TaxID=9995 RepID=A0A5E4D3D4_MARMO|nr:hypothetical protein GHT09_013582 [Marmota monax]VTJ88110.1 Hypothetical predicted protein [Marmota monax]
MFQSTNYSKGWGAAKHPVSTVEIKVPRIEETFFALGFNEEPRGGQGGGSSGRGARPKLRPAQPLAGAARCTEHVRAQPARAATAAKAATRAAAHYAKPQQMSAGPAGGLLASSPSGSPSCLTCPEDSPGPAQEPRRAEMA